MADSGPTLSNLSTETRSFPPSAEFAAQANATEDWYARGRRGPARPSGPSRPTGSPGPQKWDKVLEWDAPFAKWFVGGKLNVAVNCVDRHVDAGHGEQVAFHWEGEPGDSRTITYADLQREVCKAANALTELGVQAGDRVAIQLPMIPEAAVAMLACARLGAMHSVVFGGFSPSALKARIEDAEAKLLITSDGQFRRGKPAPMKENTDQASPRPRRSSTCWSCGAPRPRCRGPRAATSGGTTSSTRQSDTHEAEAFDAEHPLFILYTSGTTGKPKGILHTSGGYLTQAAYTHHVVFDHKPGESVYWCTADIGWVTGHSYIVYGPLANRATSVMYEGTPNTPHEGRHWEIVEKYGVSIYYTAPTLIRTFMKWGEEIPEKLRPVVAAGARQRRRADQPRGLDVVPGEHRPQQLPDRRHLVADRDRRDHDLAAAGRHASASRARRCARCRVSAPRSSTTRREPVGPGGGGYLVLDKPWPSMLRGIWGDEERYRETYWSRFDEQGYYFAGDGAKYDDDGAIWLLGRVDDVMNVSGHRISTTEVESALVSHPTVAEAAVVGATDEKTGQGIVAFVILRGGAAEDEAKGEEAIKALRDHVSKEIGPIAKPRQIMVVEELPKTRSGKIMRRLLRDVAEHREVGDVTTLADSSVMDLISEGLEKGGSSED